MSLEVINLFGNGRPAALMRTSASGRVQEVTIVQRSSGRLASKFERAGKRDHPFKVFDFAAFDFAILDFVIGVREIFADGRKAGASVGARRRLRQDRIRARSAQLAPDAGDGGSGVDEDSVHVEEKCSAVKFGHTYM